LEWRGRRGDGRSHQVWTSVVAADEDQRERVSVTGTGGPELALIRPTIS
jgi:hypothetical protein